MVPERRHMISIPISRPYFGAEEARLAAKVIGTGWISQGGRVKEFEDRIRQHIGAKYVIALNSGTASLHAALLALGIGEGDEVIIPSFSFIATANAVVYSKARPVFVDIEELTYNINPVSIEKCIDGQYYKKGKNRLINKKTGGILKAIMPVHQFGFPADMDRINSIARRYGLAVIEDAACAISAEYKSKRIGASSPAACFSFHPRKIITTAEGGAVATNDKRLAGTIIKLRNHGVDPHSLAKRAAYEVLGFNYRMSDIHAALGIAQMAKLKTIAAKRKELAKRYDDAFLRTSEIIAPVVPSYARPVYQSYVIKLVGLCAAKRDIFMKRLLSYGISTRTGNQAIHMEPFYIKHFGAVKLPRTEDALRSTISLPIYPGLSIREQDFVIDKVMRCLKSC